MAKKKSSTLHDNPNQDQQIANGRAVPDRVTHQTQPQATCPHALAATNPSQTYQQIKVDVLLQHSSDNIFPEENVQGNKTTCKYHRKNSTTTNCFHLHQPPHATLPQNAPRDLNCPARGQSYSATLRPTSRGSPRGADQNTAIAGPTHKDIGPIGLQ
jgi:hypothetical protein